MPISVTNKHDLVTKGIAGPTKYNKRLCNGLVHVRALKSLNFVLTEFSVEWVRVCDLYGASLHAVVVTTSGFGVTQESPGIYHLLSLSLSLSLILIAVSLIDTVCEREWKEKRYTCMLREGRERE